MNLASKCNLSLRSQRLRGAGKQHLENGGDPSSNLGGSIEVKVKDNSISELELLNQLRGKLKEF
jgi:hypothetical protein